MDDKGFSLVELIIVIAVASILVGGTFYGVNYIESANAKKCANSINSGISYAKSQTMSKAKPIHMFLYGYSGGYYIKYSEDDTIALDTDAKEITANRVTIVFDDGTILGDGVIKKISFNRKDGSVAEGPKTISLDGSGSYAITLVHSTGKHFIEAK